MVNLQFFMHTSIMFSKGPRPNRGCSVFTMRPMSVRENFPTDDESNARNTSRRMRSLGRQQNRTMNSIHSLNPRRIFPDWFTREYRESANGSMSNSALPYFAMS